MALSKVVYHELCTQVVSIVPYGAFVNIEGNIDGLVHISEMAMGRVDSVEDVVQVPVSPSSRNLTKTYPLYI